MSRTIKIFVLIFSQGLNALISFMFLPYLSRALSKVEYGTYGQVLLVINLLTVALACGLGKVIYIYFAEEKVNPSNVFKSNLSLALGLGSIGIFIVLLFSRYFGVFLNNEAIVPLLRVYTFVLPFLVGYFTLNATLIYFDKVKVAAQISVFTNILKVVLLLISIQVYHSLEGVFYALLFVGIVQFTAAFIMIRRSLNLGKGLFSKSLALEQLWVGLPLGLTAILGVIYKSTDSFMISNMLSVNDYAIYRNGAFDIPFISTIYGSIGAIVLPDIAKLWNLKKYVEIMKLKRTVISNTFILICPIFISILFFHNEIIIKYLSEKYTHSGIIFLVFSFGLLIRINNYQDIFIVAKRNGFILKVYLFSFFMNLGLNYFLILSFGRVGAAISTVASLLFIAFILLFESARIIKHSAFDYFDFGLLFKTLLIAIAFILPPWLLQIYSSVDISILICFHYLASYFILLRFGFFDKKILRSLANKFPFGKKYVILIFKLN